MLKSILCGLKCSEQYIPLWFFRMREQLSKTKSRSSGYMIPYILEFEGVALSILKDDGEGKGKLKELLEEYAAKYAKESSAGT